MSPASQSVIPIVPVSQCGAEFSLYRDFCSVTQYFSDYCEKKNSIALYHLTVYAWGGGAGHAGSNGQSFFDFRVLSA